MPTTPEPGRPSTDGAPQIPRRAGAEGRVLRAALGSTTNLSLLGVGSASAGALAVTLGPFAGALTLGLSAVTYAALVGLDLFNPKFVEKTLVPAGRRSSTPSVASGDVLSPELRARLDAVRSAHARVVAQIDGMGGVFTVHLQEIAVRAATLVDEAGHMALGSNALVRYLADGSDDALRAEAEKLEQRADRTRDAEAAGGFRQAAATRRSQIRVREEIGVLVDRILAQLTVIETALEEMGARLVKMGAQEAADADQVGQLGRAMVSRLAALRQDVGVIESSIADISETVKGAVS